MISTINYVVYLFAQNESVMHHVSKTEGSGSDFEVEGSRMAALGEAVILRDALRVGVDVDLDQHLAVLALDQLNLLVKLYLNLNGTFEKQTIRQTQMKYLQLEHQLTLSGILLPDHSGISVDVKMQIHQP